MSKRVEFSVVIPAAGVGARMRADRPKQYLPLHGKTVLEHTLDCFLGHPSLQHLVVSLAVDDPFWPRLPIAADSRVLRAPGGLERADSVLNGLERLRALELPDEHWVLVHDAARPLLHADDLTLLLDTLADDAVGGLLAVPARDTLKQAEQGRVARTLERSRIWQAFTPQMFRLGTLYDALSRALAAGTTVTDEASAIEWLGLAPRLVEGRSDNLKITRPEDLALAAFYLSHKGA
ncbi:2-C-methyl-D-erythritol 4-phosphate cytidylyltransferase [Atopomonas sediminilitoris]|uniref:2-C-methyl-D-erythritol 4-phosphate cytidylyltransferase n=1 Tax=Atopomonas sediminilitoris TaxID=2919919 RepID=UPI001F4D6590|nr:2-C-methyl-D-erythritol 4-phosphate cytidylyltransferase [Atopomonas sediminilitoris]MCJ8169721.1 2-C-methyl-D-erythritol 4-phosphate cytidylyltransferase [Atopomonas sediminilitoris]